MQIGIDLGATKIESIVLDDKGEELHREREESPHNYQETLNSINLIVNKIEKKFNKKLNVGVCHPGSSSTENGFIKNAHNSPWLNDKNFNLDISNKLNKNVLCENDANCFALSEAFDGSAQHYKIVFGIILGSGCGGGLIINKKIVAGPNNLTGEWGLNFLPFSGTLKDERVNTNDKYKMTIEHYLYGKGLERLFFKTYNAKISAQEIFKNEIIKKDKRCAEFIERFKDRLSRSLSLLINTIDPDAIVFGGGVSNEIIFLDEIKKDTEKWLNEKEINTVFLKPKYGDASGVRGAAWLGRKLLY